MRVEELSNYPLSEYRPAYCHTICNPGEARILLGGVNDSQKCEIEGLMDAIFVRNEMLAQSLHLSHDEYDQRTFLRIFQYTRRKTKPGLLKKKQENATGGYTVSYESGRSGNPYEAIRFSLPCTYWAQLLVGPLGEHLSVDAVSIVVMLQRIDYGDLLIRAIFERYDPDISQEVKMTKKLFGEYVQRGYWQRDRVREEMLRPPPQVSIGAKIWNLLTALESDDVRAALRECRSLGRNEIDTLIRITNDPQLCRDCPLNTQIASIRALAETGDPIARAYIDSMLEIETVQVSEEYDPGDMYNMGGRSAAEEYRPAAYEKRSKIHGALLIELFAVEHHIGTDTVYRIRDGNALRVIRSAQERIATTCIERQTGA